MMPKHIFWPIINCSSFYAIGVTHSQGVVLHRTWQKRWAWSLLVMLEWQSHHSTHCGRKPPAIHKLHSSIFYRNRVIADWSFTL